MSSVSRNRSILAVGMLPPPVGGQALMFEWAVKHFSQGDTVRVVDLQAQQNIGESGRITLCKVIVFGRILLKSLLIRLTGRSYDFLYYCPSGPSAIGVIKDIAVLALLRGCARKVVFHFHATGMLPFIATMHPVVSALAKRTIFKPDIAIRCADIEPNDASLCEAKKQVFMFNGIPDPQRLFADCVGQKLPGPHICFIGALIEEKGIFDLIAACRVIKNAYENFILDVVGEGVPEVVSALKRKVEEYDLVNNVVFHGIKTGRDKFDILGKASLFVFPTYFSSETQPLVVIEAAAMGVPAVVSDWRGLRTIVVDGVTGALSPPRNPQSFGEKVVDVLGRADLAALSMAARNHFIENFTEQAFLENLDRVFAAGS